MDRSHGRVFLSFDCGLSCHSNRSLSERAPFYHSWPTSLVASIWPVPRYLGGWENLQGLFVSALLIRRRWYVGKLEPLCQFKSVQVDQLLYITLVLQPELTQFRTSQGSPTNTPLLIPSCLRTSMSSADAHQRCRGRLLFGVSGRSELVAALAAARLSQRSRPAQRIYQLGRKGGRSRVWGKNSTFSTRDTQETERAGPAQPCSGSPCLAFNS